MVVEEGADAPGLAHQEGKKQVFLAGRAGISTGTEPQASECLRNMSYLSNN